jgi:hypothetical protein
LFHGVTYDKVIEARVMNMATMLRASGEFTLRQSDYGIKPVSLRGGVAVER